MQNANEKVDIFEGEAQKWVNDTKAQVQNILKSIENKVSPELLNFFNKYKVAILINVNMFNWL